MKDADEIADVVADELGRWLGRGRHMVDALSPGESPRMAEVAFTFLSREDGRLGTDQRGHLKAAVADELRRQAALGRAGPVVFMTDYGPGEGCHEVGKALGISERAWPWKHRIYVKAGEVTTRRGEAAEAIVLRSQ